MTLDTSQNSNLFKFVFKNKLTNKLIEKIVNQFQANFN